MTVSSLQFLSWPIPGPCTSCACTVWNVSSAVAQNKSVKESREMRFLSILKQGWTCWRYPHLQTLKEGLCGRQDWCTGVASRPCALPAALNDTQFLWSLFLVTAQGINPESLTCQHRTHKLPAPLTLLFFWACSHQMQNMKSIWNMESSSWRFANYPIRVLMKHCCTARSSNQGWWLLHLDWKAHVCTPFPCLVFWLLQITDRLSRRWDGGDGVLKWR